MLSSNKPPLFVLFSLVSISASRAVQLILVNNCPYNVWPGILGSAGHPSPQNGGFHLGIGEEAAFDVSFGWSGRIWGRQGCCFDEQGKGSCDSGDCGGQLHCRGAGGSPPATVVEMTLGTSKSPLHFYDVVAACEVNLNVCCSSKFEVKREGKVVGCQSVCKALKTDKYCCTGEYGSPSSCKPTLFSHIFKSICPQAYSFAYDDSSSMKSCKARRYRITFCPPRK